MPSRTPSRVEAENRITALHEEHSAAIFALLIDLTEGDRQAAEDIALATIIRAWNNLDDVPVDRERARRWLFTVARRLAIARRTSRKSSRRKAARALSQGGTYHILPIILMNSPVPPS
ncbi:sigma factor [Actinoplanes sp. CA-054009]